MKVSEKIAEMKDLVAKALINLEPDASLRDGVHSTLKLLVHYIDFMITPSTEDD